MKVEVFMTPVYGHEGLLSAQIRCPHNDTPKTALDVATLRLHPRGLTEEEIEASLVEQLEWLGAHAREIASECRRARALGLAEEPPPVRHVTAYERARLLREADAERAAKAKAKGEAAT